MSARVVKKLQSRSLTIDKIVTKIVSSELQAPKDHRVSNS